MKIKWNLEELVVKDNSWGGWFSSFIRTPNNEEQIKGLTEKYNQDLAKIETDAPNFWKIINDLVNNVTAEGGFYTVKIIPANSAVNKVDTIKIIDITKSSTDLNNHLTTIEDLGLFNILQNLAYQLYVAQEYQNAANSDATIELNQAKINYFNFIKNYLKDNSDELKAAFGINSEDLRKELDAHIAGDSIHQEIVKQKFDNSTSKEVKVLEVTLTGAETDTKEGEAD